MNGHSAAIRAFVYLQAVSTFNAIRQRLLRLRQPKYLFGAIAGGAYMYFFFFRNFLRANAGGPSAAATAMPPVMVSQIAGLASLGLFAIVVLAWLVPGDRAALKFSEAEVAFLFPAPLTRKTLIQFSLLRSQLGIFVSAFLMSLVFRRGSTLGGSAWQHAAGIWLILSMLNLHYLGAAFVRERLLEFGVRPRLRRLAIGALLIALALGCWWQLHAQLSSPTADDLANANAMWKYIDSVLGAAPLSWVLVPFKAVVAPYFATDATSFLYALVPVALLLVAHYVWVVRSRVSFEEASIDFARRSAERAAAKAQGKLGTREAPTKPRSAPFPLAPLGFVPIAFLWKGLIAMGPFWRLRTWLIACAIAILACSWLASDPQRAVLLVIVSSCASMLGIFLLLLGPMFVQGGMRRMLGQLDLLKSGPLRGWQIALGELLTPTCAMTFVQWLLLLLIALAAFGLRHSEASLPAVRIVTTAIGAALIVPPLCGLMLSLPFAELLYFPAWAATSGSRDTGFEVMGQRMIFIIGYLLALVVMLIPAIVLGGATYWIATELSGIPVALLAGSLIGSATLTAELVGAVDWLGRCIDRFDVSQEMPRS